MTVSPALLPFAFDPSTLIILIAGTNHPEEAMELGKKFAAYAPHFTGPLTPEQAVTAVVNVINDKSVENGDGGQVVSHFGNKQWL